MLKVLILSCGSALIRQNRPLGGYGPKPGVVTWVGWYRPHFDSTHFCRSRVNYKTFSFVVYLGWFESGSAQMGGSSRSQGTASHGFGVEIPPFHAEVLGTFGAVLSFLTILSKWLRNLCMGWGLGAFWQFCQKWPKLAACLTWLY